MPRKALVPARAALRFAQEAAGECGPAQPGRRGMRTLAGRLPGGRPMTSAPHRGRSFRGLPYTRLGVTLKTQVNPFEARATGHQSGNRTAIAP